MGKGSAKISMTGTRPHRGSIFALPHVPAPRLDPMHLSRFARALPLSVILTLGAGLHAQGGTATFDLTFRSGWSPESHPISFPGNPHFSPLVGATHDAATHLWQTGGQATPGIEQMAELGSTSTLTNEVNALITAGGADQALLFGGLSTSPAERTVRFTVSAEFSHLTLVSMLAPSPDWFVGTDGLELRPNGQWVDTLVVPLFVYDAGTDSGTSYASANQNTSPQDPIDKVTTAAGPFSNNPSAIGAYTIQRVVSTSVYGCGTNPAGSMTVSGTPALNQNVTLSVGDPSGTMAAPASTVFLFSAAPDAAFPCGTTIPGFGLAGPAGELLVQVPVISVQGPAWNGSAAALNVTIPGVAAIAGVAVYVQGVLVDGTPRIGLTDAVELLIGAP